MVRRDFPACYRSVVSDSLLGPANAVGRFCGEKLMALILYGGSLSPFVRKVLVVLAEKGIE